MLFTAQDLLQQYAAFTHDDSAHLHKLKFPPAVATLVIALRKKRVKTALSTTNGDKREARLTCRCTSRSRGRWTERSGGPRRRGFGSQM